MNRPSSAAYEEAPNDAEHREGDSPPLMVYVTAPATLPAGYTFEAHLNGDPSRTFTCEVVSQCCCILCIETFCIDITNSSFWLLLMFRK